jgi:hypothetical protein
MAAAISSQFDSVGATPRAVAILGQLHPASWAARSDSASALSAATVVRHATLNSANGSRFHLPILRSRTRSPRPRRRSAGALVMKKPFLAASNGLSPRLKLERPPHRATLPGKPATARMPIKTQTRRGLAAGCSWPVRTLTGCLVQAPAVLVAATKCGACCLSFVKPRVV